MPQFIPNEAIRKNSDNTYSIQVTETGAGPAPTPEASNSFSVSQSAGVLEASRVVKNAAGKLQKAIIQVDSTLASGTYYIQFLNAAALPADGAVTHLIDPLVVVHSSGTTDQLAFDFVGAEDGTTGVYASTGIVVVLSTTRATKTIGGSYLTMTVMYQ